MPIFDPHVTRGGDGWGGSGGEIGGGSGQGGFPFPLTYDEWMAYGLEDDWNGDGSLNINDYYSWWTACGFTYAQWVDIYGDGVPYLNL